MYQTQEEYAKGYTRMMDTVKPKHSKNMGEKNCYDVDPNKCPLLGICGCTGEESITPSKAFKIVQATWEWNQAHPVVTYGTKYKEVFGFENQISDCYKPPKTKCPYEGNGNKCSECKCEYHKDAEYHAPESENPWNG